MVETQLKAIRNHYGVTNILGALLLITCPLTIDDSISQYSDILAIVTRHAIVSVLLIFLLTRLVLWHKLRVISKNYFVANITVASTLLLYTMITMIVRLCIKEGSNAFVNYLLMFLSACLFVYGIIVGLGQLITKVSYHVIQQHYTDLTQQAQAYHHLPVKELDKKYRYSNIAIAFITTSIVMTFCGCIALGDFLENKLSIVFATVTFLIALSATVMGCLIEFKKMNAKYAISILVTKIVYTACIILVCVLGIQQNNRVLFVIAFVLSLIACLVCIILYTIQTTKARKALTKEIKSYIFPLYKQSLELEKQADTNTTSTM